MNEAADTQGEAEQPLKLESAEELVRRIAAYRFTRFKMSGKKGQWIYVKQITRQEYDEA